jgi:hypothetical protein
LRLKTRERFDWLLDHIMTESHRAQDHWILWRDVDAAFEKYWKEVNQTPRFWNLTRRAHQDSVILRLTRVLGTFFTRFGITPQHPFRFSRRLI